MIKTIIFDIGNVLTGFYLREFIQSKGYDDAMVKRIEKATVFTPVWGELDRGRWTEEQIINGFIANDPDIEKELRSTFSNVNGMLARFDYAIPWIRELKSKGYQVLYLSNFNRPAHIQCADALDFLPYMDGGILSYQDLVIKPEPEIYQLLIDRYNLIPDQCVFLDDLQANLDGAAKFGIHTILFKNQADAIEALKKLGVE
ncbi:MAG: HAD family phosphatase [Lachnospiraceae bacterium]|nr:HAD family phosphatase [Lachnospiraceae bacterium]